MEFPPGPLGFGDTIVEAESLPVLKTRFGELRIVTPTLQLLDRLAAYWYYADYQTQDRAIVVVKRQPIDWDYVYNWAKKENRATREIDQLKLISESES